MSVTVFIGPTLSREEAQARLAATYLPPAAQGDVYRAARQRPFAIGIVDGYFEQRPAVWHKEILWALSRGIHVFGAASMGALRAAELADFGMKGVGRIFEAYQSGVLEDDDEVAVVHGDESTRFLAMSEPMVNIRATLEAAELAGIVSSTLRGALEALAKDTFYPERTLAGLAARAREAGLSGVDAFQAFAKTHRVDQKRLDALSLLDAIRAHVEARTQAEPVSFSFAHTEMWDAAIKQADLEPAGGEAAVEMHQLMAEVRLLGDAGHTIMARSLNRLVASTVARGTWTADASRAAAVDERLRASAIKNRFPAGEVESFEVWVEHQGLNEYEYRGLVQRQAELESLRDRYWAGIEPYVVDELRTCGRYPTLRRRALEKQTLLVERGLEEPTLEDAGLGAVELASWYFEQRGGTSTPADFRAFLDDMHAGDEHAFIQEALRELFYQRLKDPTANK